jgi:GntR family transcriptional regulator
MRETKAKSGAGIEVSLTVKLDRASYVPYYEQIVSQMREAIVARRLPSGKALWSQRELAEILGISVLPVKRAFERLRTEGLLITSKGKRPVVGAGHVPLNVQDLWSFSEEMKSRGLVASNRLLSFALIPASEEVSAALELNEGEEVYRLMRLRSVEQEPIALEITHVPAALFPNFESHDWNSGSLYTTIENVYKYRIDRGEERIGAVKAGNEEARLLKVELGFPLLSCNRLVHDPKGVALEYGLSLIRADRYVARILTLRRRPQ